MFTIIYPQFKAISLNHQQLHDSFTLLNIDMINFKYEDMQKFTIKINQIPNYMVLYGMMLIQTVQGLNFNIHFYTRFLQQVHDDWPLRIIGVSCQELYRKECSKKSQHRFDIEISLNKNKINKIYKYIKYIFSFQKVSLRTEVHFLLFFCYNQKLYQVYVILLFIFFMNQLNKSRLLINKISLNQVIRMILIILITVSMAQLRTSVNTCTNEKTIFKLDIRQRIQSLPTNSTIKDLNASALCQEVRKPICMTIYGFLNYGPQDQATFRTQMEPLNKQMTTENYRALKNIPWTHHLEYQLIFIYFRQTQNKIVLT
ncbi:hypothetical protein pb186bvf_008913 [Paramecium bursaria]